MNVRLNGSSYEIHHGATLDQLVRELGVDPARVAVERNRELVRRESFAGTRLEEADELEIVTLVGGG